MDGLERRTARIFASDGKSVVLAFDHGMGGARHAGMKYPGKTLRDCIAAGSDAVLITPGLARQYGDDLTSVGVVINLDIASGNDEAAVREAMLLGANYAGQAFSNSPVGAVHALAYPLGGHYHVPHGLSNALMLGPVLRYNMAGAAALYAELGDLLLEKSEGTTEERSAAFVTYMEELMNKSGAPRRLRDVGVTEDSLETLARDAMLQTRLLGNNPVDVTEADALSLYREAF